MSVAKVIEIISVSKTSFDHAITEGVAKASESVSGIASAWIKDQTVEVTNGKITEYRVAMKVTFLVNNAAKAKAKVK